jgi:hypothetical protein
MPPEYDSDIVIITFQSILESNLIQISCSKDEVSVDYYEVNR